MTILSDDLRTLSHEGFIYLYPLVTMDVTRLQAFNAAPGSKPGFGPPNHFSHMREFPSAEFRAVVRPNFDTLYSSAWLDLTNGPVRVHADDTDGRYYLLPMLDMWTDVFASPGKRTTGTGPLDLVVTGPGYTGDLPPGTTVILAPTPYVWLIGRTQTDGPDDYPGVHKVQDGLRITELGPKSQFVPNLHHDVTTEPLKIVNGMTAVDFFSYAAEILRVNPPHATDFSILARLAHLGIEPGKSFDAARFSAEQRAEIEQGRQDGLAELLSSAPRLAASVNGWMSLSDGMGVYGNSYLRRAVVALVGLGANQPEDAVYPLLTCDADGQPITGDHNYVIHFDADELPPVNAFWSITMYDAEGFQVSNELNRFAIGDRDPLRYNADGSLDIYMQHANPGADRVANWLPAPVGQLGVTMRLYAPAPSVVAGQWSPPPVRRV